VYGYNILHTNSFLKHVIEGKMEGTGKRGRRCKQVLDAAQETKKYWKFERRAHSRELALEEVLDLPNDCETVG
jgi:hypothetical protein